MRTVSVRFEARPIEALQLPAQRLPRQLTTVEASLRLDALASAGFGLSRNRMATLIRQGAVRIDWRVVSSPSQPLAVGTRVQLEGRGSWRCWRSIPPSGSASGSGWSAIETLGPQLTGGKVGE